MRGILFDLHDSVVDSSAWQGPRTYRTQQDPFSKNYASTRCQWYSKLHRGVFQPVTRQCSMGPIAQQKSTRNFYATSSQIWSRQVIG